jgi:hypothetical protein
MVKHVNAAELRIVVAANAVLVAHHPPKTWCPSGYRTGLPACALLALKKILPGGGEHAEGVGGGGRKKLRVNVYHGKQKIPVGRARASRTRE